MRLIFTLLISIWLAPTYAQELWGGTSKGMSIEQVKSIVRGAVEVSGGGSLSGGAIEELNGETLNIAGKDFVSKFYFLNGALEQVMVTPRNSMTFNEARLTLSSIVDALRSKYGKEISIKLNPDPFLSSYEHTWINGKTNITSFLIGMQSSPPSLSIIYQVRVSEDAGKL